MAKRKPREERSAFDFREFAGSLQGFFSKATSLMEGAEELAAMVRPQEAPDHPFARWIAAFSANARRTQWSDPQVGTSACEHHGCDEPWMMRCSVCQMRTCLAHCMVSHHAEAFCERCLVEFVAWKRQQQTSAHGSPKNDPLEQKRRLVAARKTLGVTASAPWSAVHDAYRELAARWHPDRKGGDAERMKKINEAYALLREHEEKRAA
jgi:hypothetical protein